MEQTYYKNAGGAPLGGMVLTLVIGIIGAVILGGVYAAAIWFGPFLYLNILFVIVFGILLGMVVGKAALKGHLRSLGMVLLLALVVALIAEYVQWAAYITLFAHAGEATTFGSGKSAFGLVSTSFDFTTFAYALAHPLDMYTLANAIALEGFWSFDNYMPVGPALWAIWGAELLIIIIACLISARKQVDRPYSENTGCWMDKQELPSALPYIQDPKEFARQLEAGNYKMILEAETMPDNKRESRAKLTLFSCPNDSHAYLSATNFKAVKKKVKTAKVMKYLKLDYAHAQRIVRHMGASEV